MFHVFSALSTCRESEFNCGAPLNQCIPKGWKCDGDPDCSGGSDEASCPKPTCSPEYFQCNNSDCMPAQWRCDGDRDCRDGSDEWSENCEGREPEKKPNCSLRHFQCASGECIRITWKCDGEFDCPDRSDEANCSEVFFGFFYIHLFLLYLRCFLIYRQSFCFLPFMFLSSVRKTCKDSEFSCGSSTNRCIPNIWRCDGDEDCQNGADEKNCSRFFVLL